jgi:uncharacterized membrane protein YgdD (TMEM256/DUF423 family)
MVLPVTKALKALLVVALGAAGAMALAAALRAF